MRRPTRRAQEMQRLVVRWERSGLTQAALARQCGMLVHTFMLDRLLDGHVIKCGPQSWRTRKHGPLPSETT